MDSGGLRELVMDREAWRAVQFMGSQRVRHNWATKLNWTDLRRVFRYSAPVIAISWCFQGFLRHNHSTALLTPINYSPDSIPIRPNAYSTASLWSPRPSMPTLDTCTIYTLFQNSSPWSPISGIIPLFPLNWKPAGHSHFPPLRLPQSDSPFNLSAPVTPLGPIHVLPSLLMLHGQIAITSHLVYGQQLLFCFHFYPHVYLNLSVHPHRLLLEASCSKYKLQSIQSGPLSLSSSSTRMHTSAPRQQITILIGQALILFLFVCLFYFRVALCSMWDLSSPTRDRTRAPCTGYMESKSLNHQ